MASEIENLDTLDAIDRGDLRPPIEAPEPDEERTAARCLLPLPRFGFDTGERDDSGLWRPFVRYGMKRAVELAGVQAQAEKKLQAVLAATGGAAGFTKKELVAYAGQLQQVTNYGDEATISAMGVMASFTAIRGDVFKDSIAAAQDLQSSVVQIGKALNNPIKGMTALQRAGVAFTAEQKAQVANLMAQGDLVSAQRVILGELKTEFGGAARAMASPMTQARNAIGDLGERIGNFVKPAFIALMQSVTAAMSTAVGWVEALWNRFTAVRQTIAELWAAFTSTPLGSFVATAIPLIAVVGAAIAGLGPTVAALGSAFATMWTIATGPVGVVIAALTAVGAAVVYVAGEGETMADKFQSVLTAIGRIQKYLGLREGNAGMNAATGRGETGGAVCIRMLERMTARAKVVWGSA